jgi:nucleoside-diphosphate-sugar epimerase/SAM-dependent methyltransferase
MKLHRVGVEVVEGRLADTQLLAEAVAGTDVVFHLAWQANRMSDPNAAGSPVEEQYQVNVEGSRTLIETCKAAHVARFVYTSTVSVYGTRSLQSPRPVREDNPLMPAQQRRGRYWTNYAAPKIEVEKLIRQLLPKPDYVILRPAMVYGAGAQFASGLVKRSMSVDPSWGRAHTIQWVHVDDLAKALILAAEVAEAANEVFNICGAEPVSYTELQAAIQWLRRQVLAGSRGGWGPQPFQLMRPKYDISKAQGLLRFEPEVPFADGLEQMIAAEVGSDPDSWGGNDLGAARLNNVNGGQTTAAGLGRTSAARLHNEHLNRFYRWHQTLESEGSFFDGSDFWNFGLWNSTTHSQREACENLMEELLSFLLDKSGTIVDVACGKGGTTTHLLKYYPPENVTAINISEDQLEACRAKAPRVDFRLMDAANMEFENSSFDNVICVEAACHFHTREVFLREAYRILKPGGRLVFSDCMMSVDSPTQPRENYVQGLDEYREVCTRAGFETVWLRDATKVCWHGFRESLAAYARGKLESGEASWPQYLGTLNWLRRTNPETYVIGWCEKSPKAV